jgi:hypothetical protein
VINRDFIFFSFLSLGTALFAIALWKCKPSESVEVAVGSRKN